jgi:hypothetical protein
MQEACGFPSFEWLLVNDWRRGRILLTEEKKKRRWGRIVLFSILALLAVMALIYFIKPSIFVDFFHIGINREDITLQEKQLTPRDKLIQKWDGLVKERRRIGYYPPFTFTSQELQIFIQEHYRKAFPEEIRGLETTLTGDELNLRIKVNLAKYEKEIAQYGTPELARALKEDIVFTVRAASKGVNGSNVDVDIRAFYFGFLPLPMKLIDGLINSPANVKKYKRHFDYNSYPLPKGVKSLKIENSILYVNY